MVLYIELVYDEAELERNAEKGGSGGRSMQCSLRCFS